MNPRERLLAVLRTRLRKRIGERARLLAREAVATGDPVMVLFLLSREMRALGPELSAFLLREIVVGAARRAPGHAEVLRRLGDARTLSVLADPCFMGEVLAWARRNRVEEVVEVFAAVPPRREAPSLQELEANRPPAESLPLGTRKSLARRPDPRAVEQMIQEQHPLVVRNLLNNPRLTEDLVVRMASRRPTSPDALIEIAIHRVWSARTRVRRALLFNPFTPPRLGHTLLPLVVMRDAMDVALGSGLHPSLARAARRLILLRLGEMGPDERKAFTRSNSAVLRRIFVEEPGKGGAGGGKGRIPGG